MCCTFRATIMSFYTNFLLGPNKAVSVVRTARCLLRTQLYAHSSHKQASICLVISPRSDNIEKISRQNLCPSHRMRVSLSPAPLASVAFLYLPCCARFSGGEGVKKMFTLTEEAFILASYIIMYFFTTKLHL